MKPNSKKIPVVASQNTSLDFEAEVARQLGDQICKQIDEACILKIYELLFETDSCVPIVVHEQ